MRVGRRIGWPGVAPPLRQQRANAAFIIKSQGVLLRELRQELRPIQIQLQSTLTMLQTLSCLNIMSRLCAACVRICLFPKRMMIWLSDI